MSDQPVLAFRDLSIDFRVGTEYQSAVSGVDLELRTNEVLAVVGESGSGKSVTALASVGLLPDNARVRGSIRFEGRELLTEDTGSFASIRGSHISMIFQDPMNALDPVFTIGAQLVEMLRCHTPGLRRRAARARAVELLAMVEIPEPEHRLGYYPHQLSGGQCQRVMIAMALACDPQVLIADEPTTALDVTVQQEVLDVLLALRSRTSCSIMIITHDMGVVADVADRVVVMRLGELVEQAPVNDLFDRPEHPYTRTLLAAVPRSVTGEAVDQAVGSAVGTEDSSALPPAQDNSALPPAQDDSALPSAQDDQVLSIDDLVVQYRARRGMRRRRAEPVGSEDRFGADGRTITAVRGANLQIRTGETLGLVGESGSGKSTIGKCILALAPITAGEVRVKDVSIGRAGPSELRSARSRIGVVFQSPTASLNPRYTVGESVGEPLLVHRGLRGTALEQRVRQLLDSVELPGDWLARYPHELSGGQRQRVSIARAISMGPDLLIADEPTSALDVSVQATVLELFRSLQERFGFACLFISHDLAVVDQLCHRIAVMSRGRIVEQGSRDQVLRSPQDPYTRELLQAAPVPDPREQSRRRSVRLAG